MSESPAPPVQAPAITAKVEDAGPCRKTLRISVPPERVREELDRTFLEVIRSVHVPGFRPGHLPRKVAEMKFGRAVKDEVRGTLLEKSFGEAVERHGLVPLGTPDLKAEGVEVDPAKAFEFEVTVEVRPAITIPDLKSVVVRREPVKVEEKDVDRAVEDLRLDRAELRPAPDEAVGERDVVVLDASVEVEGASVVSAENVQYRHPSEVVAGLAVRGVSKEILGRKRDESFTVKAVLPPNFRDPAHAGKEADLRLTVRDVKRFHLPPLDEEFAKSLDFDSLAELREEARRAVRRDLEARAEKRLDDAILDGILRLAPVELPEGIVKREIGQVLARYQADLHLQGAAQEAIDEKLAEVQSDAADHVAREFRVGFLTDEYAKRKGIFVTEGEIAEQVALMAGRYGRSAEEMRKYLEQRDLFPSLRGRLRERKVMEALRKEVRIEA
jgi:trigger factor